MIDLITTARQLNQDFLNYKGKIKHIKYVPDCELDSYEDEIDQYGGLINRYNWLVFEYNSTIFLHKPEKQKEIKKSFNCLQRNIRITNLTEFVCSFYNKKKCH